MVCSLRVGDNDSDVFNVVGDTDCDVFIKTGGH